MKTSIEEIDTWFVHAVPPRDWYTISTLPIEQWMRNFRDPCVEPLKMDAWTDFLQAACAVTRHAAWRWPLREPPRAAYDPVNDTHYFIFKIDFSGLTFIVARREMHELSDELL